LLPVSARKVLFLSRQSNTTSLDFDLVIKELTERIPQINIVIICRRLKRGIGGVFSFGIAYLRSLFHIATSRVCILDSYWPAISILKLRKDTLVVQMWHSLGKIKKSGWQTINRPLGRQEQIAKLLKMHNNYNYIITGCSQWNPFYCEAFNVVEEKLKNLGLPRIDYLLTKQNELRGEILEKYPELREKQILLYAPTYRKRRNKEFDLLVKAINFDCTVLIVKQHPHQASQIFSLEILTCPDYSAMELLAVADYLITDYSAIALEAAVINVKTLYYVYDYDYYRLTNGLNIDLYKEMPGCVYDNATDLVRAIENRSYPSDVLTKYHEKFLPSILGKSTLEIVDFIIDKGEISC
jgi:CDP-ribitol ribitolphosphotransferase